MCNARTINMKECWSTTSHSAVQYAAQVPKEISGKTTKGSPGGTDGSSFKLYGIAMSEYFTGMQNIHSKLEWIGVNDMAEASETMVHLAMIWEERDKWIVWILKINLIVIRFWFSYPASPHKSFYLIQNIIIMEFLKIIGGYCSWWQQC